MTRRQLLDAIRMQLATWFTDGAKVDAAMVAIESEINQFCLTLEQMIDAVLLVHKKP